jgi:hypothetical protein
MATFRINNQTTSHTVETATLLQAAQIAAEPFVLRRGWSVGFTVEIVEGETRMYVQIVNSKGRVLKDRGAVIYPEFSRKGK